MTRLHLWELLISTVQLIDALLKNIVFANEKHTSNVKHPSGINRAYLVDPHR